ncbi:DUF397 domain-containing protein [Micromonospora endophytica]|uniref:DUF397 domain-containing protein n=1 Tax=Micromonospora endophytica TaxID=515350 RepID=A0A2W2CFH1_9ACTN|nr:DUF397 domain-containing protein [Micromonospora endophytica]PZF87059.1 DUF397 domain-containing protein [Micromonospora endophytica]RIW41264.1 DUF397 domain-containing protein [Micromonospora endophytica]BCJ57629.1 hypothetical protein Jiend_10510 [Micromonospora endophytica]
MSEILPVVAWHISTKSASNGGSCVEAGPVLDGSGRVAVRHSKAPEAATIVYTAEEWTAFVRSVKDGEFDFVAP